MPIAFTDSPKSVFGTLVTLIRSLESAKYSDFLGARSQTLTSGRCRSPLRIASMGPALTWSGDHATTATRTSPPTSAFGSTAPWRRSSATNDRGRGDREYSVPSAAPGANTVTVASTGRTRPRHHSTPTRATTAGTATATPPQYSESPAGPPGVRRHQGTAGAVAFVRTSVAWRCDRGSLPGTAFANQRTGGRRSRSSRRSEHVRPEGRASHRPPPDDPQANQTLRCDPSCLAGPGVHDFVNGCQPWYGENHFNDAEVVELDQPGVPRHGQWFGTGDQGAGFGAQLEHQPLALRAHWHRDAQSVRSATGCPSRQRTATAIGTTSCQTQPRLYLRRQLRRHARTTPVATAGRGRRLGDPRVVNLFIVPYQAIKGVTGAERRDPCARLRVVLRHGLGGQHSSEKSTRARIRDFDGVRFTPRAHGTVRWRLREKVDYEPGPGRRDRGLRRGPAHAVQGHARPLICR